MNKKPSQLTEGQSIRFTFSYSEIVATFTVDYGVLRLRFQVPYPKVDDFELSVRTRVALKKCNIRTLEDLKTGIPEELAMQLGEVCIHEIHGVLAQYRPTEPIETAFPGGVLSPEIADAIFSGYEGEANGQKADPATRTEERAPTATVTYSL